MLKNFGLRCPMQITGPLSVLPRYLNPRGVDEGPSVYWLFLNEGNGR